MGFWGFGVRVNPLLGLVRLVRRPLRHPQLEPRLRAHVAVQVHANRGGAEEGRAVPVDDAQGRRVPRWRNREEVAVHALDELVVEQMLRRRRQPPFSPIYRGRPRVKARPD